MSECARVSVDEWVCVSVSECVNKCVHQRVYMSESAWMSAHKWACAAVTITWVSEQEWVWNEWSCASVGMQVCMSEREHHQVCISKRVHDLRMITGNVGKSNCLLTFIKAQKSLLYYHSLYCSQDTSVRLETVNESKKKRVKQ
jgi:hypothetical protein